MSLHLFTAYQGMRTDANVTETVEQIQKQSNDIDEKPAKYGN
jgi:hypothetical protein